MHICGSLTATLSHKCPIPISPLCFNFNTFVCVEIFHIMNIDMQFGIGAPPLSTRIYDTFLQDIQLLGARLVFRDGINIWA